MGSVSACCWYRMSTRVSRSSSRWAAVSRGKQRQAHTTHMRRRDHSGWRMGMPWLEAVANRELNLIVRVRVFRAVLRHRGIEAIDRLRCRPNGLAHLRQQRDLTRRRECQTGWHLELTPVRV